MGNRKMLNILRVQTQVFDYWRGDTLSALRRVLLFSSDLIIILVAATLVVPYPCDSPLAEGNVTPGFEVDAIQQQALVERAQSASRSLFYENLGQVDNTEVRFYGRIPGGTIGFAESRVYLRIDGAERSMVLSFDGASSVTPQGIDQVSSHASYFLGDRGTFTGIRGFARVAYSDLWSGISLFYEDTADGAKYEFCLAPGADPTDIRVRCDGSDSVVIGETSLRIEKDDRTLLGDGLRSFQGTTVVESEFIPLGGHALGFNVGDYDRSRPLAIDALLYSSSQAGDESGSGIAVDSTGSAYVTGYTGSIDFPTVNAYNNTFGGLLYDVFVFKLSSDGNILLYSTFVGGSHSDHGEGIAVDSTGSAYVTGATWSADFPIVNAYDSTLDGYGDVFVFKLSSSGNALLYSTLVGGADSDYGNGIAVDSTGNAHVTGYTYSTDFPTVNAYNSTLGGEEDCFVFKLSSAGNALLYSTYVGGSDYDVGSGIAVDTTGNAYITGHTHSTDFPTVNAYNNNLGGGNGDVFVFKLSSAGNALLYSTYVGGSDYDVGLGIAIDSTRNAYVTGCTDSIDFPTVNALNNIFGGGYGDVFVFRLSSAGNALLYSTYVGGRDIDRGDEIAVDSTGNAYVTGVTYSEDFPTVNAYNSTHGGGEDCFVFKLSSAGDSLLYSTYVGGGSSDHGLAIAVDSTGNVYVAGYTYSTDFPTANAYNSIHGGGEDCFVFKLSSAGNALLYSTYVGGTGTPTTTGDVFLPIVVAAAGGLGLVALMIVLIVLKRNPGIREPEA